jgi:DNA adenine methylase
MGRKVTALVPWFGSNRTHAHRVGELLQGCKLICVPFAGGFCEVAHLKCNTLLISDLHRRLMQLAQVVSHPLKVIHLTEELDKRLFHQAELKDAQDRLRGEYQWHKEVLEAADYFYCCWCTRNGLAGTGGELTSGLSYRLDGKGGDSCKRYRSAVEALADWHQHLKRATLLCTDGIELLAKLKDDETSGAYVDVPWPEDGDNYEHPFTEEQQVQLRDTLLRFQKTRLVVRFGVHPLVESLYPQSEWKWHLIEGRTSQQRAIGSKKEVLLERIRL